MNINSNRKGNKSESESFQNIEQSLNELSDTQPHLLTEHASTGSVRRESSSTGSGTKMVIISLILGFVIGFGSAWLWFNPGQDANPEGAMDDNTGTMEVVDLTADQGGTQTIDVETLPQDEMSFDPTITENGVQVKDQKAGASVFVSLVRLQRSGWVVIREDVSGAMGNILGARRFDAGESQGVVELLRGTVAGGTYYAVLYLDDGDKMFDHTKDTPITGGSGVVGMTFNTFANDNMTDETMVDETMTE